MVLQQVLLQRYEFSHFSSTTIKQHTHKILLCPYLLLFYLLCLRHLILQRGRWKGESMSVFLVYISNPSMARTCLPANLTVTWLGVTYANTQVGFFSLVSVCLWLFFVLNNRFQAVWGCHQSLAKVFMCPPCQLTEFLKLILVLTTSGFVCVITDVDF